MNNTTIYMDNHATTQVDPQVLEAMLPYFSNNFGNPGSSGHTIGRNAHQAVTKARAEIARCIGASEKEIIFTSGATESNNLAIRGVAERKRRRGNHLISVTTEHHAVLDPIERLVERGYDQTLLNVIPHGKENAGQIDPQQVAEAITDETVLVSVMLANNEIGAINPVAEIGEICREKGVLFHCDAAPAAGKIPIDVEAMNIDLMSFSGHKMYGPKGIGGLYVRSKNPIARLNPQITGGGQMENRRSGTLNVPGIVGLEKAFSLSLEKIESETIRIALLRDELMERLLAGLDNISLCGPSLTATDSKGSRIRLAENLNVTFHNIDGEMLMMNLPGIAVSTGSACSSVDSEPSHVLLALGLSADEARSSLRFGLGRFNTQEEIQKAAAGIIRTVQTLR